MQHRNATPAVAHGAHAAGVDVRLGLQGLECTQHQGLVPRLCRVHTLSAFAAWGLMQGSGMLGVVPRHFIRQSLHSGALVSLPLQVPGAMPAMALVTPTELGTAAALLATHLRRSHGLAP